MVSHPASVPDVYILEPSSISTDLSGSAYISPEATSVSMDISAPDVSSGHGSNSAADVSSSPA
jgi:hypothetical protein